MGLNLAPPQANLVTRSLSVVVCKVGVVRTLSLTGGASGQMDFIHTQGLEPGSEPVPRKREQLWWDPCLLTPRLGFTPSEGEPCLPLPARLTSVPLPQQETLYMKGRELTPQLSQSSVLSLADSHTEFFDACEVLLSASSSENEVREVGRWQSERGALRIEGWDPERRDPTEPQSLLTASAAVRGP